MKQFIVLMRDVPDEEATILRKMVENQEPRTWRTFYPFRNKLYDYGFAGGETLLVENDGKIADWQLINVNKSVLNVDQTTNELITTSAGIEAGIEPEQPESPADTQA